MRHKLTHPPISCKISVVITTYNEEIRIESCIRSIINTFSKAKLNYEILMVDSSSKDRTISIAEKFPIKIIALKGYRSPSLGQYVGFTHSDGDIILFIDGDMELILDHKKISFFLNKLDDNIVGLQGYFIDYQADGSKRYLHKNNQKSLVPFLPGCAFYSRKALSKENFNPFLFSNEERDLGFRLITAGFSLLRLPVPMVNHYRRKSSEFSEIIRRHSSNFFLGSGQIFRCQKSFYTIIKHLLHLKYDFIFGISLILLLYTFFYDNSNLLSIVFSFHIFLLLYYLVIYRSINRYFLKYFTIWGLLIGFLTYKKQKIDYDFIK